MDHLRRYYSAYLMSLALVGLVIAILIVSLGAPTSAETPERVSAKTSTKSPSAQKPVGTFREQESKQTSRPQFEAALNSAFSTNSATVTSVTPTPSPTPTLAPTPTVFLTPLPAIAEAGIFWFDPDEPN